MKKMPWFKLFAEILNDQKVQTLPGDLFKFWVNVLALASQQDNRGILPTAVEMGFVLRLDAATMEANLGRLIEAGLIDVTTEGMSPHNWRSRQKKADKTNAERQKRHREKAKSGVVSGVKKGEKHNALRNAHHNALRNATVTQIVTPIERIELEELNTPPTPKGENGVCVSIQGSEPVPIETLPEAPAPQVDPAELAAVQAKAERLFPLKDFGPKIRATAGDFPLAWIGEALTAMHDGDHADWRYLVGILRRFAKQGGPDSARASPKANGAVSRAEKSKRQTEAYKRILAEMTEDV